MIPEKPIGPSEKSGHKRLTLVVRLAVTGGHAALAIGSHISKIDRHETRGDYVASQALNENSLVEKDQICA